jgi:hypothetical protein
MYAGEWDSYVGSEAVQEAIIISNRITVSFHQGKQDTNTVWTDGTGGGKQGGKELVIKRQMRGIRL